MNKDFRQAITFALNRENYSAQVNSKAFAKPAIRNTYTAPAFVQVNGKDLVLAMAIVQGARYLGTILLQPIAAHFIEVGGYQLMSFFLAGVVGLAFLLSFALKMPQGKVRSLFNGTVE